MLLRVFASTSAHVSPTGCLRYFAATHRTRTHVGNEANAIKADALVNEIKPQFAALPGYVKMNRTVCKAEWACAQLSPDFCMPSELSRFSVSMAT